MTQRAKARLQTFLAIAGIAVITVVLFGKVLWRGDPFVATYPGTDVILQYAQYRFFGASELLRGNFAQWNPLLFCGMPYHATWQSALLYPPNLAYLALSLPRAVNFEMILNVFLCGAFSVLWARGRRLSAPASFFAGCVSMLSGAFYLHVQPGHVTYLAGFAWAPLVFMAVDKLLEAPRLSWIVFGAMAVSMQIFGAHPQVVYITAFAAAPYCLLQWLHAKKRIRSGLALAAMGILSALLGAVQLWPGALVSEESSRAGGISLGVASSFFIPLENFLMLLVPGILGRVDTPSYWGHWLVWEVTVFMGITTLVLALYGARWAQREKRRYLLILALFLGVVTVGEQTPLFAVLYRTIPGFDMFRVPARFFVPATMMLGILAGAGFDALRERREFPKVLVSLLAVIAGVALLGVAFHWYVAMPAGVSRPSPEFVRTAHAWLAAHWPISSPPTPEATVHVVRAVLTACLVAAALIVLLSLNRVGRWPAYLVLCLGIAELVVFAKVNTGMTPFDGALPRNMEAIRQRDPGDYRVLLAAPVNQTMMKDMNSIWGYDSWLLGRYSKFLHTVTAPKGLELNGCGFLDHFDPLLAMFRLRYYVVPDAPGKGVIEFPNALPHALLVRDYKVAKDADESLKMVREAGFDPRATVILEQEPNPKPDPLGSGGSAQILEQTTDTLTCEVYTESPAILLVTDAYSKGWSITSLKPSGEEYQVLPANHALRAVPLHAGRHLIRMEYIPKGFVAGAWTSAISWSAALLLGVGILARSRRGTAASHYALEDASANLAVNPVRTV